MKILQITEFGDRVAFCPMPRTSVLRFSSGATSWACSDVGSPTVTFADTAME